MYALVLALAITDGTDTHKIAADLSLLAAPEWRVREDAQKRLVTRPLHLVHRAVTNRLVDEDAPEARHRMFEIKRHCSIVLAKQLQSQLDKRYCGLYPQIDSLLFCPTTGWNRAVPENEKYVIPYMTRVRVDNPRAYQAEGDDRYPNWPAYREATRMMIFDLAQQGTPIEELDTFMADMYRRDLGWFVMTQNPWRGPPWWPEDATTGPPYPVHVKPDPIPAHLFRSYK